MKTILIILLFPLMIFSQNSSLIGDVDCSGDITSEDASLILQFVTSTIVELPCEENMNGLTPEQLQEMIVLIENQIIINSESSINMIGPMYLYEEFPDFLHFFDGNNGTYNLYWSDANRFCLDLEYNDYTDWILPSIDQLINYYSEYGSIIIPNINNEFLANASAAFWTSTKRHDLEYVLVAEIFGPNTTRHLLWKDETVSTSGLFYNWYSTTENGAHPCFCVR